VVPEIQANAPEPVDLSINSDTMTCDNRREAAGPNEALAKGGEVRGSCEGVRSVLWGTAANGPIPSGVSDAVER
jgi:hypothetical protein